jgi:hypothetical protein
MVYRRSGAIGGLFLVLNYFIGNGAGSLRDVWFGFDTATFMRTALHVILPTGLLVGLDMLIRGQTSLTSYSFFDARRKLHFLF